MRKHKIGNRIRTEICSFYRNRQVVDKFCPKIEVDGKLIFISSKSSESGVIECDSREEAKIIAIMTRDRLLSEVQKHEF